MHRLVIVLCVVLSLMLCLTACDSYDKLLKSTNTERQYAAAMQYYQKGKYTKAKELFERVIPMTRATPRADTVSYYLAKCYFFDGDYSLAGYMYEQLITNYPRSPFVEEATFQTAFLHISTNFTSTRAVPSTSPALQPGSFQGRLLVEPAVFTPDLPGRLDALYAQ